MDTSTQEFRLKQIGPSFQHLAYILPYLTSAWYLVARVCNETEKVETQSLPNEAVLMEKIYEELKKALVVLVTIVLPPRSRAV